jgi:hypothetical protein
MHSSVSCGDRENYLQRLFFAVFCHILMLKVAYWQSGYPCGGEPPLWRHACMPGGPPWAYTPLLVSHFHRLNPRPTKVAHILIQFCHYYYYYYHVENIIFS